MMRARAAAVAPTPAAPRRPVAVRIARPSSNQLLQAKLRIGPVDDPFEREADRVADAVVQRKCVACAREEEDETVRLKAAGPARGSAEGAVAGLRGGTPLPASEQRFFEGRLGHDLSAVRVHEAAPGAAAIGARAFTLGHRIAFAPGEWRPGTREGRKLLAHELVHVLQQGAGGAPVLRRQPAPGQRTRCVGDVCFEETPGAPSAAGPGGTNLRGDVARREYVRGDPARTVSTGSVGVEFDPLACAVTIPKIVRFQQPPNGTWGSCEGPPAPATAVPNIPPARMTSLQAEFLSLISERLNGWYSVKLEGKDCPGACQGRTMPIQVRVGTSLGQVGTDQASVMTVTPVNRQGRSYVQGSDIVLCMGASGIAETIPHEGVHFALGHGDEYREEDDAKAARAPRGQYSPEREIESDYSLAGSQHDHGRFAQLHERHFQFVPAFLERAYPGCRASLVELKRPTLPDFRPTYSFGYASLNGLPGLYQSLALELGVPFDRLRRWELTVGPRAAMLWGSGDQKRREAFTLGLRLGFEYRTSPGQGGLKLGAFGELGYGSFGSTDYSGSYYSETRKSLYGEVGVGLGYRFGTGARRFVVGAEAAIGGAMGTGAIGPITPELERDPAFTRSFRAGLTLGFEL